ncbi:MAG: rRNA maturation factor [Rhizobacter sp.]|nr:rRNA maturation factor [Rhizobacter sp.]
MGAVKKVAVKEVAVKEVVAKKLVVRKAGTTRVAARKRVPVARPDLSLSLQFADATHRAELPRAKVAKWIRLALELPGELTVRIVDADEGRELNLQYRNKDYATNVLTFDYTHEPVVVADLVLCAPVVAREAAEMKVPLADHYAHLLIHGTLHAQGYDHEEDDEAAAMESRESALMAELGLHDPYPIVD